MRLSKKELETIKNSIKDTFGDAVVYLFGSRVDDSKTGGDIDLYIISSLNENLFQKKEN